MKRTINYTMIFVAFTVLSCFEAGAQAEVMAWGNMTGIRVEGQLMAFESSLRVVENDWSKIWMTGKERQFRPTYHRDGASQMVRTTVERIRFDQMVTDQSPGFVTVSLKAEADTTFDAEGVFFCIDLPLKEYSGASIRIGKSEIKVDHLRETGSSRPVKYNGKEFRIEGIERTLRLDFSSSVTVFVRKENGSAATLYFQWFEKVRTGRQASKTFTVQAEGIIDHSPVEVKLDIQNPGRLFEGLGGNFRLQSPNDRKVINYCLDSLRVAWGRVEMPWRHWQPEENSDPITEARAGRLNERVDASMKMAQRLSAMGMPVIVSAWFPPVWAIDGDPKQYVRRGGVQAYRLDPSKQQKIYKSITDYLVYLKQEYGVEAVMYSFNESDLGIDVLHTPREHADFIKGLGAYMASRGLATKMVLGDNSDATTFDFIVPAMNDPETHKYIGAVSFHSWRGCDDETLHKWAAASRELNVPLIIGEGSTDAAAHVYPEIFAESTFAFYEINLYTRICAICQPLSILQWQLTSDYSILWGDGIYGSTGPLRPTQRFWNLKQLASTPEQAFAIPFTCDHEEVNCAAFGNIARNEYAVHLVNNGASRKATIKGLPAELKELEMYVTNREENMQRRGTIPIANGQVTLELPAASFISLISL
jgi:hypothetical protein